MHVYHCLVLTLNVAVARGLWLFRQSSPNEMKPCETEHQTKTHRNHGLLLCRLQASVRTGSKKFREGNLKHPRPSTSSLLLRLLELVTRLLTC